MVIVGVRDEDGSDETARDCILEVNEAAASDWDCFLRDDDCLDFCFFCSGGLVTWDWSVLYG